MKKATRIIFGLAIAGTLLATGCASQDAGQGAQDHSQHQMDQKPVMALKENQRQLPNGDLQETTAAFDKLPAFLNTVDPKEKDAIRNAYVVASQNLDLLQQIPCYCGCGEEAGHLNNAQCFIKEAKDGSIVWDDHGTRCTTCMNIALNSANLKKAGKTVLEIRTIIDNKYKQGYAKPTPTPMPKS